MHFISEHLVRNKSAPMHSAHLEPHFNSERFRKAGVTVTVYLAPDLTLGEGVETVPGLHYVHSDALCPEEGVWEKAERTAGSHTNVLFFELYAAAAMGVDAVDIAHILAGVNAHSAKAYQIFGVADSGNEPIDLEDPANRHQPLSRVLLPGEEPTGILY